MNERSILEQTHSRIYTRYVCFKEQFHKIQWHIPEMNQTQKSHAFSLVRNLLKSLCKKDLLSCYLTYKWNQKYFKTHGNTYIISFYFPNARALSRQHVLHLTLAAQSATASADFKTFYICDIIWSQTQYEVHTYIHYKMTYNSYRFEKTEQYKREILNLTAHR